MIAPRARTPLDGGPDLACASRRPAVPDRVVIEARDEVVLRCGGASVALGPRGKVAIKGEHVVTRSAGVARVNGASVQIN